MQSDNKGCDGNNWRGCAYAWAPAHKGRGETGSMFRPITWQCGGGIAAFSLQNSTIGEQRGVNGFCAAWGFNETPCCSSILEFCNRKAILSSYLLPRRLDGTHNCLLLSLLHERVDTYLKNPEIFFHIILIWNSFAISYLNTKSYKSKVKY